MTNKQKLNREIRALNKAHVNCWVAVVDKLPELEKEVLLFDDWKTHTGEDRKDIRVGYLESFTTIKTREGIRHNCEWKGTEFAFNITHWMPLPPPPCS